MKKKKTETTSYFPTKYLAPIGTFLGDQLKNLKRQRKNIDKEDPFKVTKRASVSDKASPDTSAEERFGNARVSAVREQLDLRIIQTRKALAMVKLGSYGICENCGNYIDTDRLIIYPEATLCMKCEQKKEKK